MPSRTLRVPKCGDVFQLAETWEFQLPWNVANYTLLAALGELRESFNYSKHQRWGAWAPGASAGPATVKVALRSGRLLRVSKLYIKKGAASKYNHIAFDIVERSPRGARYRAVKASMPTRPSGTVLPKQAVKFIATLDDVNRMVVEDL